MGTTEVNLTADQSQIVIDAVEYHTHVKPHEAHMGHHWLPEEAYDHDYRDDRGRRVARSRALTDDGDLRQGYAHHRTPNDLGRAMLAEHERRLREINSPGYVKILAERTH